MVNIYGSSVAARAGINWSQVKVKQGRNWRDRIPARWKIVHAQRSKPPGQNSTYRSAIAALAGIT